MATRISLKTIEAINDDPDFFAHVAKILKVKPTSLGTILRRNSKSLTEIDTLKSIAAYQGKQPEDIVEKVGTDTASVAAK